jgi:hypothetical protein
MPKRVLTGGVLVALGMLLSTTVYAADCSVDCDITLRQGRVFQRLASVIAYGTGDTESVRVWTPLLVDDYTALMDNSLVRIVDGRILGGTTTFDAAPYIVATFGTADLYDDNGSYTSNNVVVWESEGFSNTAGQMLGDGTLVWRANFEYPPAQHNNLEWESCYAGQQTPIPEPVQGAKIFDPSKPGIDGTAGGDVYLGTPGAIEAGDGFYVGQSNFDGFTGAVPRGVNIWYHDGTYEDPNKPDYTYSQGAAEVFLEDNGITVSSYGSQTQPIFAKVNDVYYVAMGIHDSDDGGSARPGLFCVDAFEDDDAFTNAVAIIAPSGFRFVDHQATGSGAGPFENNHFEMNSNGQLVALTEQITTGDPNDPPTYQIVLYNPTFTGDRITGYDGPTIIADAGPLDTVADGLVGPYYYYYDPNDPSQGGEWNNALSGVGINDRGNVAFVGLYDTEEPFDPNDPNSPTRWDDAVYFYDAAHDTLHQVLRENNVITRTDQNGVEYEKLALGPIAREDGDAFMGPSIADDADVLSVNFRSNRDSDDGGSRGVAVVAIGHMGDANFDGFVDLSDLGMLLAAYGSTFGTQAYDSQVDFDLDGDIDLSDLGTLLAVYNQPR